jgi:hypothetical protein
MKDNDEGPEEENERKTNGSIKLGRSVSVLLWGDLIYQT